MDSNNLTIAATLLVALITGLLAYTSALSSKEKEVKLTVYERLGIDAHAALESLQNNTEYLLQVILFSKRINRRDLMEANAKQPAALDKLRELNVRIMFFDMKIFKIYDSTLKAHGEFTPLLFGLGNTTGTRPTNPNKYLTKYEVKRYLFELRKILSQIEDIKGKIIKETSNKYSKTLNSSRIVNKIIFTMVVAILIIVIFLPSKKDDEIKGSAINIYLLK
jgi:hypothetical protein